MLRILTKKVSWVFLGHFRRKNHFFWGCLKWIATKILEFQILFSKKCFVSGLMSDDQNTTEGSSTNVVSQLPLLNACDDHWSWNPKDLSHEVRLSGPKHR